MRQVTEVSAMEDEDGANVVLRLSLGGLSVELSISPEEASQLVGMLNDSISEIEGRKAEFLREMHARWR